MGRDSWQVCGGNGAWRSGGLREVAVQNKKSAAEAALFVFAF